MSDGDDDPFAVFGDDEDEEQVDKTTPTSSWAGQKLAEQANQRMANKKSDDNVVDEHSAKKHSPSTINAPTLEPSDKLQLWPDSPPRYLGDIQLVSSLPVGGGRGFIATRHLAPGTLVLVEEPVMTWSEAQVGKALDLISVQQILQHEDAQSILHDMEEFHPTKEQVDDQSGDHVQIQEMMQSLRVEYEEDERLREYVGMARNLNLTCRNGSELKEQDILRLLLALRYNGLESGMYKHVAMLNHDCHPNCVKFLPTSGYSEVRTIRAVEPGESLTISYLPRTVSHATRRRLLWEQHRFDIGVDSLGEWRSMEYIGNSLPSSSIDKGNESSVTYSIESATSQLEDHCREAEAVVALDASDPSNQVWNELKALEVASLELYNESKTRLRNDHHILLIPCLRLHLDACDLVQRDPNLTKSQRVLLLCRLVSSARRLLHLQERLYGSDHFDLARTHLEFAQAMEELLSVAPKQLLQMKIPGLATFEACSTAEYSSRKEHERIKSLYPHDAIDLMKTSES